MWKEHVVSPNSWFNFNDTILSHSNAKNAFQLYIEKLKENSHFLALTHRIFEVIWMLI